MSDTTEGAPERIALHCVRGEWVYFVPPMARGGKIQAVEYVRAGVEREQVAREVEDVVDEMRDGWTQPSGPCDEAYRMGWNRAMTDLMKRLRAASFLRSRGAKP